MDHNKAFHIYESCDENPFKYFEQKSFGSGICFQRLLFSVAENISLWHKGKWGALWEAVTVFQTIDGGLEVGDGLEVGNGCIDLRGKHILICFEGILHRK